MLYQIFHKLYVLESQEIEQFVFEIIHRILQLVLYRICKLLIRHVC